MGDIMFLFNYFSRNKAEKNFKKFYGDIVPSTVKDNSEYQTKRNFENKTPKNKLLYFTDNAEACNREFGQLFYGYIYDSKPYLDKFKFIICTDLKSAKDAVQFSIDSNNCIEIGGKKAVIIKNLSGCARPRSTMKKLYKEFGDKINFILKRDGFETARTLNVTNFFYAETESDYYPQADSLPVIPLFSGVMDGKNFDSIELFNKINRTTDEFAIVDGSFLPNTDYGYTAYNTICAASFGEEYYQSAIFLPEGTPTGRKAVHAHIYSMEVLSDLLQCISSLDDETDIYVSTDTESKIKFIKNSAEIKCPEREINFTVFDNSGKDIIPFIKQMAPVCDKYTAICHIHSKKATSGDRNAVFRRYLLATLLRDGYTANRAAALIENQNAGLIFPDTSHFTSSHSGWDNCRENVVKILESVNVSCKTADYTEFPLGSMFWTSPDIIKKLTSVSDLLVTKENSDDMCHAILRSLPFITRGMDKEVVKIKYK